MRVNAEILPSILCIALLSACASSQLSEKNPLKVTPMVANSSNTSAESMYQLGRYYQGMSRYDLAIDAYQKALSADISFVEALNGLGVIYARQQKFSEAIAAFKSAIQLSPNAAHILNNLGYVYYLQGQYVESVQVLEHSILINPKDQRALNNLGLAYAKAGNNTDAEQAFSKALAVINALPDSKESVAGDLPTTAPTLKSTEEFNAPKIQTLSIPKNIGVIKLASKVVQENPSLPEVTSSVALVQVSPFVYELHSKSKNSQPIPIQVPQEPVAKFKVEVANANGVTGLARKFAEFLHGDGYYATRITNQKPYQVISSEIQYRKGFQLEAQRLQTNFPQTIHLVQRNDLRADVSIRILLGRDIASRTDYFNDR